MTAGEFDHLRLTVFPPADDAAYTAFLAGQLVGRPGRATESWSRARTRLYRLLRDRMRLECEAEADVLAFYRAIAGSVADHGADILDLLGMSEEEAIADWPGKTTRRWQLPPDEDLGFVQAVARRGVTVEEERWLFWQKTLHRQRRGLAARGASPEEIEVKISAFREKVRAESDRIRRSAEVPPHG